MAVDQTERILRFEASARLQRLFGRDLIPDEYSAVEELVKNAYDSNASEVIITIIRPTEDRDGEIEIRDNGLGLTLREFARVWMRAGYSEKTGQPLPETGRIQVGEKGIGRFAADKLGLRLIVLTKTRAARETLKVEFDWSKFESKRRLLHEIPIPYSLTDEPLLGKGESGTILRINGLRSAWSDKEIEALRGRLSQLLNPYQSEQVFKITLNAPRVKLSGLIIASAIREADFEWEVYRNVDGKVRIDCRMRDERGSPKMVDWKSVTKNEPLPADQEFGAVNARFFFFVGRPKKALVGNALPGVAVFRDGMRVEPAGSSSADWLGLLAKRAKRAGHMPLVPSRLFGFVEISRHENPDLQDATNRRSFIHGHKFDAFGSFLKERLAEFEAQVESEVAKPRWEKSRQMKSQTLVQAQYKTVSILSLSLAHELRQPLQSIHTASENIVDHLKNAGISIKEVDSATDVIKRNIIRIDNHIRFLKALGSGPQESESFNPVDATDEVISGLGEYASARNIKLERESSPQLHVVGNRTTFLNTLTNLVLNACQAIDEQNDGRVHHVRTAIQRLATATRVRVIDDGPGIPEANRPRLFKRQTTGKQGGMGIGLIVWREALQLFGGELECESFANPTTFVMTIPTEATRGQDPPG